MHIAQISANHNEHFISITITMSIFHHEHLSGWMYIYMLQESNNSKVQLSQSSYQTPKLAINIMYIEEEYRLKYHTECSNHSSS